MSVRKMVPIEQAEWSIAEPPAWLENFEPDWDFKAPGNQGVTFLLIDQQHHVATQAHSQRTLRRLETMAAVQALSQVEIEFEPAAQRLLIHELTIWRVGADGSREKRSLAHRDAFLLRQREQRLEQQILNGQLSLVALLEDVRVGDVIEMLWTLEPRNELPGLRFTAFVPFGWTVPVGRVFVTLHRPVDEPLFFSLHQSEGGTAPTEEATPKRLHWKVEQAPPYIPEPRAPAGCLPMTMLEVSCWSSWGEVAEFFAALWADALAKDQEAISALAGRFLAGNADAEKAARAVIRFVQEEVRYLGVDFGHGSGLLPNGVGTVLRRRFGDCKDKSVLLVALLRALGFTASPLLVSTLWHGTVARLHPSPAAFNHVIVHLMLDGKDLFVDPTAVGAGGDLRGMIAPPYGCGLEVREGVLELRTIPALPPASFTLTETFHLDAKGQKGSVVQEFHATSWLAEELRGMLLRDGEASFFKSRGEALREYFPALLLREGETGRVTDNHSGNVIEMRAEYGLPTWGEVGDAAPPMFRHGARGLVLVIELIDGPRHRLMPWVMRHPIKACHRVIVRGECVQKAERDLFQITGPGFAYTCDLRERPQEVSFEYLWESRAAQIPAEYWAEYCRRRTHAFENAGANVVTKAKKPPLSAGSYLVVVFLAALVLWVLLDGGSRQEERSGRPSPSLPETVTFDSIKLQGTLRDSTKLDSLLSDVKLEPAYPPVDPSRPPDDAATILEAVMALIRGGREEKAMEIARQITLEHNEAWAWRILVIAATRTRNEFEEESAYRAWLKVVPRDPEAIANYGSFLQHVGRRTEARTLLKKALNDFPNDGLIWLNYSSVLLDQGEGELAMRASRMADALLTPAKRARLIR